MTTFYDDVTEVIGNFVIINISAYYNVTSDATLLQKLLTDY